MADEQNPQVIDTDTMSLADIRAMAVAELETETRARDDKGRFVKTETAAPETAPVVTAPTTYRREIDLGDGSGRQVFEASTLEGLADALANAQKNATKMIREQSERLRTYEEQQAAEAAKFSQDDEYILSQEMMNSPSKAVAQIFKKETGYDIAEFKSVAERSKAYEAAQAAKALETAQANATDGFLSSHPEYVINPRNGKLLTEKVELMEARAIRKGEKPDYASLLIAAYDDLNESGLLQLKSADAADDAPEPPTADPSRIASPDDREIQVQRNPKRASSLAGRASSMAPVKSEPSEDELYRMDLSLLKDLANQSLRKI